MAAINKGQLPIALAGLVFIIVAWRMPEKDLGEFILKITTNLENGYFVGYALSVIFLFAWVLHAKSQRSKCAKEIRRIVAERDDLQRRLVDDDLGSSD